MPPAHLKNPLLAAACILAVVAGSPHVRAQTAAAPPATTADTTPFAYDVISIKPNNSGSGSSSSTSNNGRFSATNVTLKQLLQQTFEIKEGLISGITGPLESARFDIEAKVVNPDPIALKKMTRQQSSQMLLPLLTERFQLKTHIEVKTLPVYELVVKGGPKFKPSKDQATKDGDMSTNGSNTQVKITARKASMESLAKALSSRVDRTVINKTGLTGNFDLDLQWSREDSPDSGADAPPDIFTAIEEQLGLKLEPAKGPVDTLVVDHAEIPSEN